MCVFSNKIGMTNNNSYFLYTTLHIFCKHKKRTPKGLYVYYRIIKSLGYPPLGMGITSPGKNGISGILEQGRFLVQRFLGVWIVPG